MDEHAGAGALRGVAPLVLPLDSPDATLESCGGKGLGLARLVRAGFPVPPGFVLLTDAYRAFVAAHGLGPAIEGAIAGLDPADAPALEAASARIRGAFDAGGVQDDIADAVRAAWARTFPADAAVAVRSSATAEDLPDLSFAGQQDTFLNVVGVEAALTAVVRCWSSLWTARAIGYRLRNALAGDVALAVVVQRLVPAEVSGVLFTANPLTGSRDEVVIDATWGLGEALVSGQVEPDHVVVTPLGTITRTVGAKAVVTTPQPGGGVLTTTRRADDTPALSDEQVLELADLGRRVADAAGVPQDLEWAIVGGEVRLLQARPITSLYPVPEGDADAVWFSFGAVQGMLQPLTPLGQDAIRLLLSGVTELVGPRFDLGEAGYLRPAGERLWIRVDRILHDPLGARLLPRALPVLEPSAAAILAGMAEERGWGTRRGRPGLGSVRGLARVASGVLTHVPGSLLAPARRRRRFDDRVAALVADAGARQAEATAAGDADARLAARARAMRATLTDAFPVLLRTFAPIMAPAMALLVRLRAEADASGDRARELALEVLRGLPGNVTTEMDLALWQAAVAIRADAASLAAFTDTDAAVLAERLVADGLPDAAQVVVTGFLDRYGMRGVGEIDLGQPRWRENPLDLVRSLQSYVRIDDPAQAPDVVFARGRDAAARATDELAALLGREHGVRFAVSRLRALLGARETPKFTMIRLLGLIREGLLESGRDLVAAGVLDRAEDVFFLHLDELERLPQEPAEPWRAVVAARRQVADRERRRGQVPRLLVGDGRAFHEGLGHADAAIVGSPVSPGVVEGPVRVVLDPQATHLLPGEILVCPGTDPAWTPLFLSAGGLVTEVGGMMTHGSVVAREYGIPAVVGVHEATTRLLTGQRIRLDGTAGTIEVLEAPVQQ